MNATFPHPLDKMFCSDTPLKPEEKQFLMEALEAAAQSLSNRSMEKTDEAKSTHY